MTGTDHQIAFEQLMAYVDGELRGDDADAVRAHLTDCQACQEMERDVRSVSRRLTSWTVEDPPATLTNPAPRRFTSYMRQWMPIAATLILALGAGTFWVGWRAEAPASVRPVSGRALETSSEAPSASARPAAALSDAPAVAKPMRIQVGGVEPRPGSAPLLARTARLVIVAPAFDAARAELERIVSASGGFIGNVTASGDRGVPKSLRASLRIPEAALDATLAQLKGLGRVTSESRDAEDVTQQSSDLNARLENARVSEKRLNDILAKRTGDLSDVLNVEREIARVRGEIEQMEAARRTLDRRTTYATVSLELFEEEKAGLDLGATSLSLKLRNAAIEGWNAAFNSVVTVALLIAQAGPTILLWGLGLALPIRIVRRRFGM